MKSTRKAVKTAVWNWKDDFSTELASKSNSELIALNTAYDSSLNSNVASQRLLEQAIIIRSELNRRNQVAEKLLSEVMF